MTLDVNNLVSRSVQWCILNINPTKVFGVHRCYVKSIDVIIYKSAHKAMAYLVKISDKFLFHTTKYYINVSNNKLISQYYFSCLLDFRRILLIFIIIQIDEYRWFVLRSVVFSHKKYLIEEWSSSRCLQNTCTLDKNSSVDRFC